jgi:hypothetical protein
MELTAHITGLDVCNGAFVNEVSELLAASCKTKVVEKDGTVRVTYTRRATKRALIALIISGSALSIHIYADNINRYIGDVPDHMSDIMRKGRECDGIAKHPTCIGGFRLVMDGKEYHKCRYMNFKFDVNVETRPHIMRMITSEMSCL